MLESLTREKSVLSEYSRLYRITSFTSQMNDFSEQEKDSFYKAVYSRRDVRSNFTSEPIDEQVLTRILKAAHHAPSVGFSQPWNFILIKNIETRKKIKESFQKEKDRKDKK